MDTAQLVLEAKARFSHNLAKIQLKNKYAGRLIVAEQGGLWTAKPELLSFLGGTRSKTLVVVDNFDNPVKVLRAPLLAKLTETYNTVMTEWEAEWTSLEGKR